MRNNKLQLMMISAMIAYFSAPTALAQQSNSELSQLEEIIVTAQKRQSKVQETPISLTAVSGADFQNRGATDLNSVIQSVPGVSLRTSGPGMTEIEMRGIASTGGNSPTVGFYFDETPLTSPAATNEGHIVISPALYDLNRVEVLRGPQGTLYGSSSMGGTIKVVPNAANPDAFDASAETAFGDTEHGGFDQAENGMANFPIVPGLVAVRLVGTFSHDSGWIDRVVIAPGQFPVPIDGFAVRGNVLAAPVAEDCRDVNDADRATVRVSALIKPAEGLSVTPSLLYETLSGGGLPDIDGDPGTNAHYQPFDVAENYFDNFTLGSLNVKYEMSAFELSSTTSYWTRHEPLRQDSSESWETGLMLPGFEPADGGIGAAYAIENNVSHQITEELRITSVGKSRLKWLFGYFYEDFKSNSSLTFPAADAAPIYGSNELFLYSAPQTILQQSVFGEVTYNIIEPLAVTVGLRRYHYDAPVEVSQSGALTATLTSSASERDQGITPKISLSYGLTKDLLFYAIAAEGFRPGGGTGPVPTSGPLSCEAQLQVEYGSTQFVPGPISFKSDSVWSYELGQKLRAADNRITINASTYFERWSRVQQTNSLSSCGYLYMVNSGDAHVYGGEFEIQAIIVPNLVVSANTSYSHAALVKSALIDAGLNPGTPIQDVPR
jgi:outer membrane receptor protein involved in Fe transport